ncbi:NADH-quinone oxidoreductase subunit H 1 [Geothrix rubra]|uniref:NADH-quinone oxidoreductase subunit H n=1 Tax=Geothrix rubra TaxID=2927977 RepID=A0ABQ5Q8B1_9BACT|nr:complex I subunit 1 family protein [Geothrix rubra]GLH71050.1 NADH-quinone oxidoreductase subunit H 1 [Geothrix rubra]
MPTMTLTQTLVMGLIQIVAVLVLIFVMVPLLTFAERKVIGYVQVRLGATRTAGGHRGLTGALNRGMWAMGKVPVLSILRGLPVFIADILKLILKEDIIPEKADRAVFTLAPILSVMAAFGVFSAIAFYPGVLFTFPAGFPVVGGLPFMGFISDVNVSLLYIIGLASVGVYGIVLGAWASNSKYPLLGGLRSAAQIVSYEVPLTLSLLVPVVLSGSLNFREMSLRLATGEGMSWLATFPLMAGFLIYTTCGFAETNRTPFDLPEAENELVAGFHTEYSGMKFGFFYLAEYTNMIVVSTFASGFFLGGYHFLPFGLQRFIPATVPFFGQPSLIFFFGKVFFILFTYLWVRATLPRYRYDQLMDVGWKYLIPLTLVNLFVAALIRFAY